LANTGNGAMSKLQNSHERLSSRDEVRIGSNRSFGIVFSVVFAAVGIWPLFAVETPRYWALLLAVIFLFMALVRPAILTPLNNLWFGFGLLLHRVVNPLILGLIFFLTITPIALVMRLVGKDPLCLKFDPKAESYWIARQPPGPSGESMRRQF
jgi:hypothetical protein